MAVVGLGLYLALFQVNTLKTPLNSWMASIVCVTALLSRHRLPRAVARYVAP